MSLADESAFMQHAVVCEYSKFFKAHTSRAMNSEQGERGVNELTESEQCM